MKTGDNPAKTAVRIVPALLAALAGGGLFRLLHLPIPWLLGPMIAALAASSLFRDRLIWPAQLRNTGMIVVGYTIGLSMTLHALREILKQLPYMVLMTALLMLFCAGIAYLVSRLSGTNYKTALMGSIPGGLTQMIALAEESEGINLTIVTVTQVIRLMVIIVCIPLLVFSPVFGQHHGGVATQLALSSASGWAGLFPDGLLFAAVCIACAVFGKRINFPTAYLLGPAIGTMFLQLGGWNGPALPPLLSGAAQLMIGTYVGLLLKPGLLPNKLRTLSLAIGSGLLLVLGAWGISFLLGMLQPISASTGLLSLAPGGMDQMGMIAGEIHADLSMVVGYQLFRAFFIMLAVPPIWRMVFRTRRSAAKQGRD